ncbi:MAG: rubrerythrin [Gammaproteobacteria bacterium]|nr:MAG: rubrerythrin [Gammaproteobacteria bacterium]
MSEGSPHARERLAASRTLQEILSVAVEFERSAERFYTELAPKVSKHIRWLVEELAQEEQRHVQLFSELMQRPDIEDQLQQRLAAPPSDTRFSDAIQLPDLGEHPDDQAVLQYALGREQAAMEQYQSLAEEAEPGPIRDLFAFLAAEETEHKAELEKIYYEVVHSGGV